MEEYSCRFVESSSGLDKPYNRMRLCSFRALISHHHQWLSTLDHMHLLRPTLIQYFHNSVDWMENIEWFMKIANLQSNTIMNFGTKNDINILFAFEIRLIFHLHKIGNEFVECGEKKHKPIWLKLPISNQLIRNECRNKFSWMNQIRSCVGCFHHSFCKSDAWSGYLPVV